MPATDAAETRVLNESGMKVVAPTPLDVPVSRDPDDDWILATTLAGTCECIIPGDQDLLALKEFRAIRILGPSQFWQYETSR